MGRTPRHVALEFGHNAVADFLKTCEDDMRDPHSGFAQMRTNEYKWEILWCLYGLFLVMFSWLLIKDVDLSLMYLFLHRFFPRKYILLGNNKCICTLSWD